jgi:hypothetical protein
MEDKMSRRDLLQKSAALSALAVFGVAACGKKQPTALVCTDTTGLSPADLSVRTALAYVDVSTTPGKTCTTCQQFVPNAAPSACGTCKVLKGPINPTGNCKSYLAKVT